MCRAELRTAMKPTHSETSVVSIPELKEYGDYVAKMIIAHSDKYTTKKPCIVEEELSTTTENVLDLIRKFEDDRKCNKYIYKLCKKMLRAYFEKASPQWHESTIIEENVATQSEEPSAIPNPESPEKDESTIFLFA